MDKNLRRILELSGQLEKNAVVQSLEEAYDDPKALDHQGPLKGLEGPWQMKSGRVVYYDPKEGKYYDRRMDLYLSDDEAKELHGEGAFQHGIILHASRGDEKINLRVEGMMAMKPLTSTLLRSGYGDFEMTDDEGNRGPIPDDDMGSIDSIEPMDDEEEMDPDAIDPDAMGEEEESQEEKIDAIAAKAQELAALASDAASDGDDLDPDLDGEEDVVMDPDAMDTDAMPTDAMDDEDEMAMEMRKDQEVKVIPSMSKGDTKKRTKAAHTKSRRAGKREIKRQLGEGFINSLMPVSEQDQWEIDTTAKIADMDDDTLKSTMTEALAAAILAEQVNNPEKAVEYFAEAEIAEQEMKKRGLEVEPEEDQLEERELTDAETTRLDGLKKKHENGPMWDSIMDEYGAEKGKDVFYGKLTKMAKEGVEDDEEVIDEAAEANVHIQKDYPFNAVDDQKLKDERTGRKDRTETKNKVPKGIITAIDKRVKELEAAIDRYDEKGYNDGGAKPNAVEALEKIKEHLNRGDHEGFMEAQIFFLTLMSPITDLLPGQIVNYLAKGDDDV